MIEIIKQASFDLHSFDNNEIVKVAGVLRKLKNWLSSLGNEEYKKQIENLRNESVVVNNHLSNLSKHINLLQSAIKDVDIRSYELELEEVKFLSKQLTDELEKLNYTVDSVKVPEEKSTQSKNRAGYDVPVGSVNKAYKSFEHFNQIPADLININETVKPRVLLNVNAKLQKLKFDDQVELLNKNSNSFFIVLKEAITNGIVLENTGITDTKKERPTGQMYVKIRTAPFSVPGLNLKIQGIALLTDLYAQKSPKMKLSLMRFTDVEIEKLSSASERKHLLKKLAEQVMQKKITNLSGDQLANVLKNSYIKVFGQEPTLQTLGTAWAQSMAEQSGHYVNNNIGNITATKDWVNSGGKWWTVDTTEFDNNGSGHKESMKFRVYDSIDDGAVDYWRQLGSTFKNALKWFGTGDALHSGLALGDSSYYTADRTLYSGNMSSLYETFLNKVAPSLNLQNKPTLPPSKKFPEYKAHSNSSKQTIPEKEIEKINKNTKYKIINDNDKQYIVLNDKINQNKSENENNQIAQNNITPEKDIDTEVNELMNYLFKSANTLESIVKLALEEKLLPKSQILISIASINSYSTKIKYATIVSELLEKNIDAKTEILSDGDNVNINCIALGENKTVLNAVLAICDVISDGFYINKGKIVKSILKINQISKLASVSFEEIDRSMRKCELEEII